jgi:hypothetical protein
MRGARNEKGAALLVKNAPRQIFKVALGTIMELGVQELAPPSRSCRVISKVVRTDAAKCHVGHPRKKAALF